MWRVVIKIQMYILIFRGYQFDIYVQLYDLTKESFTMDIFGGEICILCQLVLGMNLPYAK